jgi:hypothetical protein
MIASALRTFDPRRRTRVARTTPLNQMPTTATVARVGE